MNLFEIESTLKDAFDLQTFLDTAKFEDTKFKYAFNKIKSSYLSKPLFSDMIVCARFVSHVCSPLDVYNHKLFENITLNLDNSISRELNEISESKKVLGYFMHNFPDNNIVSEGYIFKFLRKTMNLKYFFCRFDFYDEKRHLENWIKLTGMFLKYILDKYPEYKNQLKKFSKDYQPKSDSLINAIDQFSVSETSGLVSMDSALELCFMSCRNTYKGFDKACKKIEETYFNKPLFYDLLFAAFLHGSNLDIDSLSQQEKNNDLEFNLDMEGLNKELTNSGRITYKLIKLFENYDNLFDNFTLENKYADILKSSSLSAIKSIVTIAYPEYIKPLKDFYTCLMEHKEEI